MPQSNSRLARIEARLRTSFQPDLLKVEDDSARHAGHAGASEEGETHYSVEIVAAAFAGLSRLQRQRAVMDALKEEFDTGLHALALRARASGD